MKKTKRPTRLPAGSAETVRLDGRDCTLVQAMHLAYQQHATGKLHDALASYNRIVVRFPHLSPKPTIIAASSCANWDARLKRWPNSNKP